MSTVIPLPKLQPVVRNSMSEQVYRQLRDGLMSGRFTPGQKLTIRGLAEALGSSPMPVREALQRLQAENAFDMSDSSRLRVATLTVEQLREVRDARVALEGLLAERAAINVTPEDKSVFLDLYKRIQTAVDIDDQPGYLWNNFAFHRRIYQTANARLILSVVENFWLLMGPCFALVAPDHAHLQRSMDAHTRILEALATGDGAAARAAVTDDIMQAATSLERLLLRRHHTDKSKTALKRAIKI